MSTEPQDFEELKQLLASKQREVPAQRFFSRMSDHIRDRLQHPPPPERPTWWQRLRSDIDLKACAVGVVVCGLMLYAMLSAMGRVHTFVVVIDENPARIAPPAAMVVRSAPALQPIPRPEDIPASTAPVIVPGTNVQVRPTASPYYR